MVFCLDNGFRNKVKNFTEWFNALRERPEVAAVLGVAKPLTLGLKMPVVKKQQ